MRVAIVHDYLIEFGGAERVLVALHELYPDAPIYVSINRLEKLGSLSEKLKNARIIQSWFGYLPFADKLISPLRFLLPTIWGSFDLREYDLIISSASWAVTKGFNKRPGQIEICYCHSSPRYLYGYDTSRKFTGVIGFFVKIYAYIVNKHMRIYDYKTAQKVTYFVANSQEIARRIKKHYNRDSVVIYPPVDIQNIYPKSNNVRENYYLTGGRLVAAKNFDLIINAFNRIGFILKIYGTGPYERYLKKISKSNVEFLGRVTENQIANLYSHAKAFVIAQKDEDFGITPVEAMGYGTPVIAYKGGGYVESVVDGKTGLFFDKFLPESLINEIKKFEKMKFKSEDCINQAKKFSKEKFKKEMVDFINTHSNTYNNT